MSTETPESLAESKPITRDEAGVLIGVGVLFAVVGLLAMVFPLVSGLAISIVLGAAMVLGGLSYVASAFAATGMASVAGRLLLALVYAGAGVLVLANPVLGLTTLTLLLVAYFLVEGVVLIGVGVATRSERHWALTVLSGALSLVLALMVWLGLPSSAAWALGLLFGVNLLVTGATMVVVGRNYRRTGAVEETPSVGSPGGD